MLTPMIPRSMCRWVLGERLRPCSTAVNESPTPLMVRPEYSGPVVAEDSWTFERLNHLVSGQVPESLTLEFKESTSLDKTESKRKELSKDVSAMANSAGGVIVYGVREDPKTHVAASLDEGVEVAEIAPDWIEQVADSNIQPKIDGLIVHMVHPGSNIRAAQRRQVHALQCAHALAPGAGRRPARSHPRSTVWGGSGRWAAVSGGRYRRHRA